MLFPAHACLEAVLVDTCGPATLDEALARAVSEGSLAAGADGVLRPAVSRPLGGAPRAANWARWRKAGFEACLAKPVRADPRRARMLAIVFATLRERAWGDFAPHWVASRHVVSLALRGAGDLRAAALESPAQARAVHARCLAGLASFLAHEGSIRARLARADLAPAVFPVAERWSAAARNLVRRLGDDVAEGLAGPPPRDHPGSRTMLFLDPKPANFVARRSVGQDVATADVWQVDLDMTAELSSLALQLVLVFFAHPVAFEVGGAYEERVHHLHGRLHAAGRAFGVAAEEIDDALRYHLVRNLDGALASDAGEKARAMAALLATLWPVFGGRDRRLAEALTRFAGEPAAVTA